MNRSCNSILCRFGIHTADPNELGDKGDKGECFCKDFFQIGVF